MHSSSFFLFNLILFYFLNSSRMAPATRWQPRRLPAIMVANQNQMVPHQYQLHHQISTKLVNLLPSCLDFGYWSQDDYILFCCSLPPMDLWSWSLVLEFTSPLADWRRPWGMPRQALSWLGSWWMPSGISPHSPDLHYQQEANFSISSLTER